MKSFKKNQSGFTLVEIAIVVAVIALLLIGLGAVPRLIASTKSNAETSELPLIVANIQKVYANVNTYPAADITATLANLSVFPEERVGGTPAAPTVTNRWGGAVVVTGIGATATITYPAVPSLECTQILPAIANRFNDITVAGTTVMTGPGVIDQAALGTQCNSADPVQIIYTIPK